YRVRAVQRSGAPVPFQDPGARPSGALVQCRGRAALRSDAPEQFLRPTAPTIVPPGRAPGRALMSARAGRAMGPTSPTPRGGAYPGYGFGGRWAPAAAWTAASWGSVSSSGGYPEESTSYDYGSSVVYEGENVYVDGESVGTAEEYSEQAAVIADTGKQAEAPL